MGRRRARRHVQCAPYCPLPYCPGRQPQCLLPQTERTWPPLPATSSCAPPLGGADFERHAQRGWGRAGRPLDAAHSDNGSWSGLFALCPHICVTASFDSCKMISFCGSRKRASPPFAGVGAHRGPRDFIGLSTDHHRPAAQLRDRRSVIAKSCDSLSSARAAEHARPRGFPPLAVGARPTALARARRRRDPRLRAAASRARRPPAAARAGAARALPGPGGPRAPAHPRRRRSLHPGRQPRHAPRVAAGAGTAAAAPGRPPRALPGRLELPADPGRRPDLQPRRRW